MPDGQFRLRFPTRRTAPLRFFQPSYVYSVAPVIDGYTYGPQNGTERETAVRAYQLMLVLESHRAAFRSEVVVSRQRVGATGSPEIVCSSRFWWGYGWAGTCYQWMNQVFRAHMARAS